MKKVLVIGATGMLGKPVTKQLIKAGFDVSVMSRNEKALREMFAEPNVFQGDLKSKADLRASMSGQDVVYLNLSVLQTQKETDWLTEREGLQNVIEIAKEVNLPRIALLSSLVMNYQGTNDFDWWVFRVKENAIRLIKDSGIPHSIYYPSTFMESYSLQIFGNFIAEAGKSFHKMYFIAAEDYGNQVANDLGNESTESREFSIQGTEAFTYNGANRVFAQYSPKKLTVLHTPLWVFKMGSVLIRKVDYLYHIMTAINNYPEKFESEKTWLELGKPAITLKEFFENYKFRFDNTFKTF
ncbi:MAG: hypothetical protein ACJA1O_002957 [Spirosomataceae bacterium]|jgi:uncharacterized protein YbjT (DUF2867 family)